MSEPDRALKEIAAGGVRSGDRGEVWRADPLPPHIHRA